MLKQTLSMSERLACKAVGLARSTYRRLPIAATPADPDADLRAWLRAYAIKEPCHGFRRAWAALRHDEGQEINVKKVHRLWCQEGLQRRVHSPRKRAGVSSAPEVIADAPKVVWAALVVPQRRPGPSEPRDTDAWWPCVYQTGSSPAQRARRTD